MPGFVRRNSYCALCATAGMLVLLGCSVGSDYSAPDTRTITSQPYAFDVGLEQDSVDGLAWWSRFNDPQLDQLIKKLSSSNLDLKIAEERLREARARRGIAESGLLPTIDGSGSYQRLGSGENALTLGGARPGQETDMFRAGALVGWEIDLWGRVQRLVEQADAQVDAAGYEVQASFVSLSGELAINYFELLALRQRTELAIYQADLQKQTLELAQSRLDAGVGTEIDVAQAERTLEQVRARIPELVRAAAQTRGAISVLLGERVDKEVVEGSSFPAVPPIVGVGQPSDLLLRRADVRAAERRFAASIAAISANEGERYPRITLGGSFMLQSNDAGGMFDNALVYSFGPSLSWPLFDAGRIDAQVGSARAVSEQSRLEFERTLLAAINEIESAGEGLVQLGHRVDRLRSARIVAQQTVELATDRYKSGVGNMQGLLDAKRELASIDDALVLARQTQLAQSVRLYRALGGAWLDADGSTPADRQDAGRQEDAL